MKKTLIFSLFFLVSTLCSSNIVQASETGNFNTCANSRRGTSFTNNGSLAIILEIFASGKWNIDPSYPFMSAEGNTSLYPSTTLLPSAPYGALIVRRKNESYELIGSNTKIRLYPKETVYFLANDRSDGFGDNKGCINIEWESN